MNSQRDILLFAALALAWGTAFSAIEIGLGSLPPLLFAAFRLDVATVLFVGLVAALGLEWRPRTRADAVSIVAGGVLLVGAHYGLLFVGQLYVSSAVAAIVLSLTPIVTPPIALALLPRERIRPPAAVGLVLGLVGVVVIAVSGGSLGGQALGVGLLFGSALSIAVGSVVLERTRSTLSIIPLQTWAMGVGGLALHAVSVLHPGESVLAVTFTSDVVAALAYLGVVSTAGGFLAYFTLLERVGATELSLVNYTSPVIAAVFGWLLLGESITAATIVGFALIVLGFTLCKIDSLWKIVRPIVDDEYGRSSRPANGFVVGQNPYVRSASHETETRSTSSSRPSCAD
ncbi:DMT family transporter [Halostagnicola kamekurae]|uniref:Permease of the drug/metabolite transporter (DMT) superfamily n=1 Tax=Halostagnicola kamekurae TaxID=619731 RepID=A0A1I6NYA4_9EURY|nr:DMT family transporter [Halostagnicola kamekurae]SFS32917.1 Permease of the drug/metabolite transporter (DMT) superfamily [Halostagnicola kamekurae]